MKSSIAACSGMLLLDKPRGLTSNAALREVKKLYRESKVGHSGSLDPLATGMLTVCLGEATKFSSWLLNADKSYRFRIVLGMRTNTGDADGEVIDRQPVNVTAEQLEQALENFRGTIEQVPPMFSAVKYRGRPLYEMARQGREVERQPRIIRIHSLTVEEFALPEVQMQMHCSKGAYVRTVADDLGQLLGCGAHVCVLRRLRVSPFEEEDMQTLEQISQMPLAERRKSLLPCDAHLQELPILQFLPVVAQRLASGMAVPLREDVPAGLVRMYWQGRGFMGLAEATSDGMVRPKRIVRFLAPEGAAKGELQTRVARSSVEPNLAGDKRWQ